MPMEAMHRTLTAVNEILARIVANESHHKRKLHRTATNRCIPQSSVLSVGHSNSFLSGDLDHLYASFFVIDPIGALDLK
ncbi:hypothetical protein Pst134EB_016524 [Puccinia striiformis f. sp. tritici]|nr:hypothetical protein Pst134EB_016524 [Puccinia striiformis f. sp. tritici]